MSKEGVFYLKLFFFKKMLMVLTAVKNINCNQTKFVLHWRGRWKLLPWTQVEHMRQGGYAQIYLQKYWALLFGLALGCKETEVREKHKEAEQVLERHEAMDMNWSRWRLMGWKSWSILSAWLLEVQVLRESCSLVIHFKQNCGSNSSRLIKLFILLY